LFLITIRWSIPSQKLFFSSALLKDALAS